LRHQGFIGGSKVYFPVYVKGGGLSMGDLHFSQGDGEITFCGAIEMAGWLHLKVDLIKGGVAKYGIKNPIFKPSPIVPTYNDYLIFEGISVDEQGKQHYLDVHIAYRQACLNAIEYLTSSVIRRRRPMRSSERRRSKATSPAWSISPMPAPRCGCPRISLRST
jgi:acetamidase/formamidase